MRELDATLRHGHESFHLGGLDHRHVKTSLLERSIEQREFAGGIER